MTRAEKIEKAARAALSEYRRDLRAARWSDKLLEAMDALRAALAEPAPSPRPADTKETK